MTVPGTGQAVFKSHANTDSVGRVHQYLDVRTGAAFSTTHLHVGWDPSTDYGFAQLTTCNIKPVRETSFTANGHIILGEWQVLANPTKTIAQIGLMTPDDSIVWSDPCDSLVGAPGTTSAFSIELPGPAGVIAFTPSTTTTYGTSSFVALPYSQTITTGPGLLLFAWDEDWTVRLDGCEVRRPHCPPPSAIREYFEPERTSKGRYIDRPQMAYGCAFLGQVGGGI